MRDDIKTGRDETLRFAIKRLVEDFDGSGLDAVLGPDVLLVPAPGHSLRVEGGFWGPKWIADALLEAGFGCEVLPCLERITPVPKSAFQPRGARPGAEDHFDTIRVLELPLVHNRITIVDDVVTRGSTLLGAARRLASAMSSAVPTAFTLIRTMGLIPDIDQIVDPCVGTIRESGSEIQRDP